MKKKTIIKKIVSSLLIISIFASVSHVDTMTVCATTRTPDDAINWVKSKVGTSIDVDGYYGAQCVDLIMAYYEYLGVNHSAGNGADYIHNKLPAGWTRIQNAIPQKGDILVYTGGYGHVAIFESTNSSFHQNYNYVKSVTHHTFAYNSYGYITKYTPYWGVIRPNWNNITSIDKPGAPSTVSISNADVGLGDALTASWSGVSNASDYTVELQCTTNGAFNQSRTVGGTTTSFTISNPGTYRVLVRANNSCGSSGTTASGNCVAHSNCIVTYKDWNDAVLERRSVKYGANSSAPVAPSREGYTFQGWSSDGKSIKSDTTITATYKINTYSVKFVDYNGETIGNIQKVEHGRKAVAPTDIPTKAGYVFSHWNTEDYQNVTKQLDVQAVYVWENADLPIVTEITSATRNAEATGYNIGIKMSSFPDDFTKGKIVTALKTRDGKMVASETTSISLPASGEFTDNVFVMYSGLASYVEVSIVGVVDDDTTGTPKSTSVTKAVDVGNQWSDWSGNPAPQGNDIISESRTEYRYKDKKVIKATAKPATPAGYTYSNCQATGTYTGFGPWSAWTFSSVAGSALRQVEARTAYRFYAFICSNCGTHDPLSGVCSNCGSSVYWSERWEGYRGYDYGGGYVPAWNGCSTKGRIWLDGNWWYFEYDGCSNGWTGTGQPAQTQYHYRDRQEYYNYTYWMTEFSNWQGEALTESANRKVETRTAYRFKTNSTQVPCYNYKRYKYQNLNNGRYIYTYTSVYADSMEYPGEWEYNKSFTKLDQVATVDETIPLYNGTGDKSWYRADLNDEGDLKVFETSETLEDSLGTKRTITGKVEGAAGKHATLMVYKGTNSDPTASQIEYIGQTILDEDGTYSFTFIPKEEPSVNTGDFVITLGVEGATNYIEIGRIDAPKPTYTVEFVDENGEIIGEVQTVKEGDSAVAPEVPQKEGYDFVGWDTGLSNVHDNLIVTAEYKKKTCTVVFADWNETSISVKSFDYGDTLSIDTLPEREGKRFSCWMDENGEEINTVKDNMIVTASYVDAKYTVVFLDWDGNEIKQQEVDYLGEVNAPEISDNPIAGQLARHQSEDQVFVTWNSYGNEKCVMRDMIVSPISEFVMSADNPSIAVDNIADSTALVSIKGRGLYESLSYYIINEGEGMPYVEPLTYSQPFEITENATVYAFASGNRMNDSEIVSQEISLNATGSDTCKTHALKHVDKKAASCTENGNKEHYICSNCGKYFADKEGTSEVTKESITIPATGHKQTIVKNKKKATVNAKGYTGDTYCKECGTKIAKGKGIPASVKNSSVIQPVSNKNKATAATYVVTSTSKKTVTYKECKTTTTKATIPDTIKDANGQKYKVTAVANGAFKGNRKLKTVVIGKNVASIGKNAFSGNVKLSNISLNGNSLKKVGVNAFKGVNEKCKITVQAKNQTQYKKAVKMLKKCGATRVRYVFKKK